MLRWNGWDEGAVLVEGGADQVRPPRLPIEPPPPARASARPGARASARAAKAARTKEVRRMVSLFRDGRRDIGSRSGSRQRHAFYSQSGGVGAPLEPEIVGRGEVGEHLEQVPRNGDFRHRLRHRSGPDYEPRPAPAVVARDAVHAHADQLRDVEP